MCYTELIKHYQEPWRYYHNLDHLTALFKEFDTVKSQIQDTTIVTLAIFYHDVIYDVLRSDNEAKSATLCEDHLTKLHVPDSIINDVTSAILASGDHSVTEHSDINLFMDMDLAVLGAPQREYKTYCRKIRYEYIAYPGVLFDQGRALVLAELSSKNSIFKTDHYTNRFEEQARENLEAELKALKSRNYTSVLDSGEYVQYLEFDSNLSEFYTAACQFLDELTGVRKITHASRWLDSGCYQFDYRGVRLQLNYEGSLGTYLKTEANPSENDRKVADELFEHLTQVRLTSAVVLGMSGFLNRALNQFPSPNDLRSSS